MYHIGQENVKAKLFHFAVLTAPWSHPTTPRSQAIAEEGESPGVEPGLSGQFVAADTLRTTV